MEVLSAEAEKLKSLIQNWWTQPEQELECTFGPGGSVNTTDFLAIAARLRSKGFQPLQQEDRLSIILPEHLRFTLTGNGEIMKYCRDDSLADKTFVAMIKDRASVESNLDFQEYDVRVKARRELLMAPDDVRVREIMERWPVQKKAFRLLRRWSFKGKGVRFDLSMVRSTRKDAAGHYKWVKTFREQNIFKEAPVYEVEVELMREEVESPAKALTALITGVGEILRGIQKNSIVIRKSQSKSVLDRYKELVGSDRFRGVAPITLTVDNMVDVAAAVAAADAEDDTPNIRNGYNVTDKADGLRVLGFCDKSGELFLIDMAMNIYKTGLASADAANSLVDGEWVTRDSAGKPINQFLVFDIYYAPGGEKVDTLPFIPKTDESTGDAAIGRYKKLTTWEAAWNSPKAHKILHPQVTELNKLQVASKKFVFGIKGTNSIFNAASRMLDMPTIYHTDGLIFTPNFAPLPQKAGETFYSQFKWKPAEENTIDFLVNFEKNPEMVEADKVTIAIDPTTKETLRYKTLRLYVGSDRDPAYNDPRSTILGKMPLPSGGKPAAGAYKPILFNPRDFPDTMANTCNLRVTVDVETGDEYVLTAGSEEPIRDGSIVEMKYVPTNDAGWRWVPLRVRHDKTERLMRGTIARTLNSEKVAESVWNSIHNPITPSMIRTGSEVPSEKEIEGIMKSRAGAAEVGKKYYERKASEEDLMLVRGLRDFHNRYIKEDILYKVALRGGQKKIVDVACGKAGDLQKWRRGHAAFVLGVDTAGENIRDPVNGAYRRYMDTLVTARRERVPRMVFAIGDSSLHLVSGEAGSTPEERDILRSVFGQVQPEGSVPAYIQQNAAGELRSGADAVVCMFALHYFFKNMATLDGIVKNIDDVLAVGGYFIGCCFDGEAVFNMLRDVPKGGVKVGKEGDTPVWTIKKLYDQEELLADESAVGLAIDVEFVSIGTTHTEYLMPFKVLQRKLADIGLEVLTDEEARAAGIGTGTDMFEASHAIAERAGKKYPMSDSVKEFSYLNRWFVFRRATRGPTDELRAEVALATGPEALAGPEVALATGSDAALAPKPVAAAPVLPTETRPRLTATEQRLQEEIKEDAPMNQSQHVTAAIAKEAVAATRAAEAQVQARTIPTTAAPVGRRFEQNEIFLISGDSSLTDSLGIKDTGAGRWLALNAPFPIIDKEEDGTEVKYPSVEHYIAAMKYKKATNKPELARTLFAQEGSIHQDFEGKRLIETQAGKRALTEQRDAELLKEEATRVKLEVTPQKMKIYRATYNESAWAAVKDDVLRTALKQRFDRDARFKRAVEAARNKGKYLLYYTGPSGASELGGVRRTTTGMIEGENKVGRFIMSMANFPPF